MTALETNLPMVHFNSIFSALQALFSVLNVHVKLNPNQSVVVAQALAASRVAYSFCDIDFNAQSIENDALAIDYAGVLPQSSESISIWLSSAGYLDGIISEITVIDLLTLNPAAKAKGAVIIAKDERLIEQLTRFATLQIQKAQVWNDKVSAFGVSALMDELVMDYWTEQFSHALEAIKHNDETIAVYADALKQHKALDLLHVNKALFFPMRLAPEFWCPKEDIYTELLEKGVDVSVRYKPLYRYDAFKAASLRGCEDFYKASLALPVHGIADAQKTVETFLAVLEKYAYRSCSF